MKTITLLLISFATLVMAENFPAFVQKEMKIYSGESDSRAGFSRPMGWGTGTYKPAKGAPVQFTWFAYNNSDAWLQFKFDKAVQTTDLVAIEEITDSYKRAWEAKQQDGGTWIGTTNDWVDEKKGFCSSSPSGGTVCQYRKVLDGVVATMNKQPFLKLTVGGYLK